MTFKSLGLSSPLLKAIQDSGYAEPTPVQKNAIPMILNGSDMVVSARTGTGKTAGFTLPILELLYTRKSSRENGVKALIICPTRELADQIYKSTKLYGKYLNIRTTVVYGGGEHQLSESQHEERRGHSCGYSRSLTRFN